MCDSAVQCVCGNPKTDIVVVSGVILGFTMLVFIHYVKHVTDLKRRNGKESFSDNRPLFNFYIDCRYVYLLHFVQ